MYSYDHTWAVTATAICTSLLLAAGCSQNATVGDQDTERGPRDTANLGDDTNSEPIRDGETATDTRETADAEGDSNSDGEMDTNINGDGDTVADSTSDTGSSMDTARDTSETRDTGTDTDATNNTVKGACCRTGGTNACINSSRFYCNNLSGGGNFFPNQTCADTPCSFPTGACCTNDSCDNISGSDCSNGTYYSGTTCSTQPCQNTLGACCLSGACLSRSRSRCNKVGGQFHAGKVCTSHPC